MGFSDTCSMTAVGAAVGAEVGVIVATGTVVTTGSGSVLKQATVSSSRNDSVIRMDRDAIKQANYTAISVVDGMVTLMTLALMIESITDFQTLVIARETTYHIVRAGYVQ